MRSLFPLLVLCLTPLFMAAPNLSLAAEASPQPVDEVLHYGPVQMLLPAFHDAEKVGVKVSDLFAALPALPGRAWPRKGSSALAPDGRTLKWEGKKNSSGDFEFASPDVAQVRYLAFYLDSDRYQKASLQVQSEQEVKAYLNGEPLSLSKDKPEDKEAATTHKGEMVLPLGKHLVVVSSLYEPAAEKEEKAEWACGLAIVAAGDEAVLWTDLDPERQVDIGVVLNAPRLGRTVLNPGGTLAALSLSAYPDGKNRESWLEIRELEDGKLRHIWRTGQDPSNLSWSPDGKLICWHTTTDGQATIHFFDPNKGQAGELVTGLKDLGSWRWTPDSKSIIYEVNREAKADERKVKRVLHPADRQSWWRNRRHLMQVFVPDGIARRLTAGPLSPGDWEVSPDGKRMLFFTGEPDLSTRPYSTSRLWIMDLETLAVEMVLDDHWISGATWSPDGKKLALRGSPSAFDGLGRNLPDGMQANDYGGQLYLFDLKSREPEAISKDLRPDVGWYQWSRADGKIYTICTDTQYRRVYRYTPGTGAWERLDTGLELTDQLALPHQGHTALARGTSVTTPNRAHVVDLKKGKQRLLLDPGEEEYRDRVFGKVTDWPVTLDNGMELDGFVYYPPHFDPAKKYPLIVYYYGGTSPVTRDFGGRYPKNTWAGQGYIVYVPNPSGATGYGQEFAARHVNDWGILTADEVIEGTRKFLAAHPYADGEAVGCIGASYGGFLTQYIVTRTDIFAAAVSHAGISSISSYWGEGLWGYAYGARALANSFPWRERDLYIEQSPLFHADKVTTPLLLVHGASDTNVPIGESDQMFTALKMLGKEVEYVQIEGQDHWIVDHEQRMVWHDTILAFFAKHLKQREAWWEAMYPAPKDY
jgi:dipeptidyl aminopeptidase/acylaminoacyl peptidase